MPMIVRLLVYDFGRILFNESGYEKIKFKYNIENNILSLKLL